MHPIVNIVIGFEVELTKEKDFEYYMEDFDVKGMEFIWLGEGDENRPYIIGRILKSSYFDAGPEDLSCSFSPKELQEEIDFTRKLMEGQIETDREIKLYITYGWG